MSDDPKLLPCPFCGIEASFTKSANGELFDIGCNGRRCIMFYANDWNTTKERLAEMWNTRTPLTSEGDDE